MSTSFLFPYASGNLCALFLEATTEYRANVSGLLFGLAHRLGSHVSNYRIQGHFSRSISLKWLVGSSVTLSDKRTRKGYIAEWLGGSPARQWF